MVELVAPGGPAGSGCASGEQFELAGLGMGFLDQLVDGAGFLGVAASWGFDDRVGEVFGIWGGVVAFAAEEEEFVSVADPFAEPDRRLDPDQVGLVREAPGGHQLERLGEQAVDGPEVEQRVVGRGRGKVFELVEGEGGVVVLGGGGAVGVAELPGRVGKEDLEGAGGEWWWGGEVVVAPRAADAAGGEMGGDLTALDALEQVRVGVFDGECVL